MIPHIIKSIQYGLLALILIIGLNAVMNVYWNWQESVQVFATSA